MDLESSYRSMCTHGISIACPIFELKVLHHLNSSCDLYISFTPPLHVQMSKTERNVNKVWKNLDYSDGFKDYKLQRFTVNGSLMSINYNYIVMTHIQGPGPDVRKCFLMLISTG